MLSLCIVVFCLNVINCRNVDVVAKTTTSTIPPVIPGHQTNKPRKQCNSQDCVWNEECRTIFNSNDRVCDCLDGYERKRQNGGCDNLKPDWCTPFSGCNLSTQVCYWIDLITNRTTMIVTEHRFCVERDLVISGGPHRGIVTDTSCRADRDCLPSMLCMNNRCQTPKRCRSEDCGLHQDCFYNVADGTSSCGCISGYERSSPGSCILDKNWCTPFTCNETQVCCRTTYQDTTYTLRRCTEPSQCWSDGIVFDTSCRVDNDCGPSKKCVMDQCRGKALETTTQMPTND